ncbi:MAG: hypothetical protein ACM30G_01385 [Micromonosporaceae bacterium]
MATTRRPTKAEIKRARAEAAQAALARAERRARNIRIGAWSAAAVAALAIVIVVISMVGRGSPPGAAGPTPTGGASTPAASSGVGRATNPPWNAPADVPAAVTSAGLSMLGAEGNAVHIHTHLDVIVNGAPVTVPADIGVDEAHGKISPLHSHDPNGVIHVESPTKPATFTLGQFFAEWQVSLGIDHIGGLVADDTHHLKTYINGKPYTGNPADIVLAAHDEIALIYGTDAQQTNVPSSYAWANGL